MTYTHTHTRRHTDINLGLIGSPQSPGPRRLRNNSRTTGLFLSNLTCCQGRTHTNTHSHCVLTWKCVSAFIHIVQEISCCPKGIRIELGPILREVSHCTLLQCWVRHPKADMALLFFYIVTGWRSPAAVFAWPLHVHQWWNLHIEGKWRVKAAKCFSFFPSSFHLPPNRKPCIITCIIMTYYLIRLFDAIEFRLETI